MKRLGSFKELEEAEELNRKFKNLISKKRLESFKEYLKKSRIYRSSKKSKCIEKKIK